MPVLSSDVLLKYSAPNASAAGIMGGSALTSLGGYISNTIIPNNTLDNLFDDITGIENATSQTDYRCIFVHNNNGSGSGGVTLYNVIAYISSEVAGATNIALAADPYGQSPVSNNTIQQALTIATPTIAPSIGNFSSPYSADVTNPPADAISLGNITAGYCVALWIKRTATNSTAVNNDGVTIMLQGDSPA